MCTQILVSDCGLFLMSDFDTRDICAPFCAPCDPVSCTAISCVHENDDYAYLQTSWVQ